MPDFESSGRAANGSGLSKSDRARANKTNSKKHGALRVLLALKMFSLTGNLTQSECRVGAAILEHFNRDTEQCDPSVDRLAALLGMDRRTVFRAIDVLDTQNYIRRVSHGGKHNRNSYIPNWDLFAELEAAFRVRFDALGEEMMAAASPFQGRASHLSGGQNVTRTYLTNPALPTCNKRAEFSTAPPGSEIKGVSEQKERKLPEVANHASRASQSKSHSEAAHDAAEARWNLELTRRLAATPDAFSEVLDAITDELRAEATAAELNRRGGGIQHLITHIGRLALSWGASK